MKRAFLAFLIALAVLFSSACAPREPYIESVKLSQNEQTLLSLVMSSASLYHFNTRSQFESISTTLNVYHFGKLIDTKSSQLFSLTSSDGKIAVLPDAKDPTEFFVRFSHGFDMLLSSAQDISGLQYVGFSGMPERIFITEDEEYVLYKRVFGEEGSLTVTPEMLKSPEGLKDFEYVFYVTCHFSTESVLG